MKTPPMIMALDLATTAGWAIGRPGESPSHGTHRFAKPGASHESIFAAALKWANQKCIFYAPDMVVWEAPLPTSMKRGKTTADTTALLYGLPAVIGATCFLRGIYDLRKAETRNVRLHFIGQNPKREIAKKMTKRQCAVMGWDVADDNEADALAIWSYMTSIIAPELAVRPMPLFRGALR